MTRDSQWIIASISNGSRRPGNALRCEKRAPIFQNFLGEGPQTPLRLAPSARRSVRLCQTHLVPTHFSKHSDAALVVETVQQYSNSSSSYRINISSSSSGSSNSSSNNSDKSSGMRQSNRTDLVKKVSINSSAKPSFKVRFKSCH